MNDRIKQLAEQADQYAEQTVHYYQGQFDGLTWEGKIKQTRDLKFAESIVLEAIGVLQKRFKSAPNHEYMEIHRCVEDVKKHFGVEE